LNNTNSKIKPETRNRENKMDSPEPCRLLSLPAELRLRIYSFALAPTGTIYLHRTPSKRHAVTPSSISPALLATNRQIHSEATGVLYVENVVHIAVDAHDTAWPAINESRLPQPVLQRLEHLCVLLDCSAVLWGRYGAVDFGAFTALTALKTLRLRALVLPDESGEFGDGDQDGQDPDQLGGVNDPPLPPAEPTWKFPNFALLAVEILERVPASTRILYGPDEDENGAYIDASEGSEQQHPHEEGPLEPFNQFYTPKYKLSTLPGQGYDAVAREVRSKDLQESLRMIESELELVERRGKKAGTVLDVWADYRAIRAAFSRV
jgi:hypothetical protein